MKILKITIAVVLILIAASVIFGRKERLSAGQLFERYLIQPVPDGFTNLTTLYYFNPTLGDGSLIMGFEYSGGSFDAVLKMLQVEKRVISEELKNNKEIWDSDMLFRFNEFNFEDWDIYVTDDPHDLRMKINSEKTKAIISKGI